MAATVKSHPLYESYRQMVRRCNQESHPNYPNYGGRGIKVDDRWLAPRGDGFRTFLQDMGERPEGTSLDRVDNDKGYSKENCRWATPRQQVLNTRSVKDTPCIRYTPSRKTKWRVYVMKSGVQYGGYRKTLEEAIELKDRIVSNLWKGEAWTL